VNGRICSINGEGIWVTDGLAVPTRVSDKLSPLFTADGVNLGAMNMWTAAPFKDRVVFNITRAGSSLNNLMLEYHPAIGWTVAHSLALGPMTMYTKNTSKLIAAGAASSGKIFETFKGGADDGSAIAARYQTPWIATDKGNEARLRYLRVYGRAACVGQLMQDFATVGENYTLNFDQGFGFVWDVDHWDVGVWGDPATEGPADTPLDQVCKYVSFIFSNSTSTSAFKPALLGDGVAPEVGAWAVYGVNLDFVKLGT